MKTVAVIVGSLSRDSLNRKFAQSLSKLASDRLAFKIVEIGDLPLYNNDLWENPPASVLRMKAEVEAADAVLFVTPEYNRSFTPAIKNAIDWGSRPYGASSWQDKPAAVTGTTPGAQGTAAGQNALKHVLVVVGTILMGQPEVYFQYKPELFDENGNVSNAETKAFLSNWVDKFSAFIERLG